MAELISGWRNTPTFAAHVLAGRWFMFFASLLIMSVAGATYMFGLYSGDIKSSLGYDQTTLNLLSFFKDLGGNIGIISGLINEITPPWVVLSIGAVTNFFGYFMIWLAVTGRIKKPQIWQMCLYITAGANSQSFANTGALVTCVKNFPESRGVVLGILKGFVGLSGAIITQIFHALYGHDNKSLILLIGWLPAVISIIFLKTIRIIKVVREPNETKIFYKFLFISLGLAGFLMAIIILQNTLSFNKFEFISCASIVTVLLIGPIFVVVKQELDLSKIAKLVVNKNSDPKVVIEFSPEKEGGPVTVRSPKTKQPSTSCFSNILKPPERGDDYTIFQALFSVDMLTLFATTTFGVGGTLTAIDNLGQIGNSLGYPKESITTFISLVSIWNYFGRVFSGFVSEILLKKYKFPRPLMLTFILLFSCVGHLLIAFGVPNSLYVSSVIMGFCFGAQWPLIFAIISELFGLKYYSTLYNFGAGASPVGAYVLNVRIAGSFYDKEAMKQMAAKGLTRAAGQDLTCTGVECYKMAFIIITGATLFGCLVSFILVLRTRNFYRSDIYKRFREAEEVAEVQMDSYTLPVGPTTTSEPVPVPAPVTPVKEQGEMEGAVKNNRLSNGSSKF